MEEKRVEGRGVGTGEKGEGGRRERGRKKNGREEGDGKGLKWTLLFIRN